MITFAPLMPPPGAHRLPLMDLLRLSATEDPAVIQLVFQVERANGMEQERLMVSVPLKGHDAAGLLRSLRMLQERGLIPLAAEPDADAPLN
jgi:hypothetical protein